MMWDIADILACPYCKTKLSFELPNVVCVDCGRIYHQRDDMIYMYDGAMPHWGLCQDQLKALSKLLAECEPEDRPQAGRDHIDYPYIRLEDADLPQRAVAALFNVAKELITEKMLDGLGYAVDVGATRGWASFRLAEWKRVIAVDINDHPYYGMGSVPSATGNGIQKIIADGCYLPVADGSVDIIFMASALHHMHDKVMAMNEAHRVLSDGGVFVAIGDAPMPEHAIEGLKQDGVRDYEGMPYTENELRTWFEASSFSQLDLLMVKYCDGMEYMGYDELVREDGDQAVIFGRK